MWLSGLLLAQPPTVPTAASASAPLTLEDCIKRATEAPSAVVAARQNLEASRYAVKGASSAFLPKTVVNNGFTLNSGSGTEFEKQHAIYRPQRHS